MVTGPGDELAAAAAGRGRMRASHADREQAIDTLKAAFVQGMLAKDEFDLRVSQAFASRTYAELAALTADFPVKPTAAQPPKPARAQGEQPVLRPGPVIMVATALYAGVWPFLLLWPANSEGDTPAPVGLLFSSTTLIYLVVVALAVGYMIAGSRERRSGGQLPPRPMRDGLAAEGERDGEIGDGLMLCQAHRDTRARHLPGHRVIQRIWRSVLTRRASAGLCT